MISHVYLTTKTLQLLLFLKMYLSSIQSSGLMIIKIFFFFFLSAHSGESNKLILKLPIKNIKIQLFLYA